MLSRHLFFLGALASLLCHTVKTQGCFRTEHTGCRKRCNSNSDCRGRNKQCLCDGACGKSCVNPRLVCPNLESPPNGQLGYVPAARYFNSRALFYCDQGYELQGSNTRRCRGNEQWSGETPVCDVRVFRCSAPDPPHNGRIRLVSWNGSFVPDGEHQRTSYTDGETFGYECNPGFHLQGVTRRTCSLANHGWDTLEPTACLNYTACGVAGVSQAQELRIVGGTISPEGKWRWQAALYSLYSGPPLDSLAEKLTSNRYRIKCGGSLIDNSWVLTAAHCLDDGQDSLKRYFVKLGIADRGNEGNMLDQRQASDVDWIYIHREYNAATSENDIALVHLSTPVTIGRYVGTVCLPDVAGLSVSAADMYSGRGTVTGWGHTRVRQRGSYAGTSRQLREVQLPIQSREVCSRNRGRSFQPNTFCAGAGVRENGTMRDSCSGDSGGPLSRLINEPAEEGRWIQLGIVSTGTGCGLLNEFGVYVNVSSYTNWIRGATALYERQQNSCEPPEFDSGYVTGDQGERNITEEVFNGTKARVVCLPGMSLSNPDDNVIMCLQGSWNISTLECNPDPCEIPELRRGQYFAGEIAGQMRSNGSTIFYQCGYQNFIHKCFRGRWNPPVDDCLKDGSRRTSEQPTVSTTLRTTPRALDCSIPEHLRRTYVLTYHDDIVRDNQLISEGEEVRAECLANHRISYLMCFDGGLRGERPSCGVNEDIRCQRPLIPYSQFQPSNTHEFLVGDILRITCDGGYLMTSHKSAAIECLRTGRWDETGHDCVKYEITYRVHGTSYYERNLGHQHLFVYKPERAPISVELYCRPTPQLMDLEWTLENGEELNSRSLRGGLSKLTIENPDVGSSRMVCFSPSQNTGTLIDITISETTCGDPGEVPLARRYPPYSSRRLQHRMGDDISYWCDYPLTLVGENLLMCQSDGQWSHVKPQCQLE